MTIAAGLIEAYQRTEYRVSDRGYHFVMRVDAPDDALRSCHEDFGVRCSTFITAWNPKSVPTPDYENEIAQQRLEQAVATRRLPWLRGVGVDPTGAWPGEPSLLVLGLDERGALDLAREFGQHAIVWSGPDAVPRLIVLDASR